MLNNDASQHLRGLRVENWEISLYHKPLIKRPRRIYLQHKALGIESLCVRRHVSPPLPEARIKGLPFLLLQEYPFGCCSRAGHQCERTPVAAIHFLFHRDFIFPFLAIAPPPEAITKETFLSFVVF